MIVWCRLSVVSVMVLFAHCGVALAHESRPLYVEITERGDSIYEVRWKSPPSVPQANSPRIVPPDGCELAGNTQSLARPAGRAELRLFRCPDGLNGASIGVAYPLFNPSVSTLVRVVWRSGQSVSVVAGPDRTHVVVPERETASRVAQDYLRLGIEHILEGVDHLLFVACLLFVAGTGRRILITVTGFTLAHSLTLALAALGLVRVPVPAVETAIALSIVFLAAEIARPKRDTITWRFPILVSASFGLLHGFGFAAVLGEIGLPESELVVALLFFNVGVEVGQLLFVLAAILLFAAAQQFVLRLRYISLTHWFAQDRFARPAAYAIGVVASYWMVERMTGLWV